VIETGGGFGAGGVMLKNGDGGLAKAGLDTQDAPDLVELGVRVGLVLEDKGENEGHEQNDETVGEAMEDDAAGKEHEQTDGTASEAPLVSESCGRLEGWLTPASFDEARREELDSAGRWGETDCQKTTSR
jgi:hypothetical protein